MQTGRRIGVNQKERKMNKSKFEKNYMEKSWKEEKHQAYKKENVDDSIIKFQKFLESKKIKGRLLDVGCGNGKNTIFFQQKGFDATGIDFAKNAIEICKDNAKHSKIKPNFLVADTLSFQSKEKYDAIID